MSIETSENKKAEDPQSLIRDVEQKQILVAEDETDREPLNPQFILIGSIS